MEPPKEVKVIKKQNVYMLDKCGVYAPQQLAKNEYLSVEGAAKFLSSVDKPPAGDKKKKKKPKKPVKAKLIVYAEALLLKKSEPSARNPQLRR